MTSHDHNELKATIKLVGRHHTWLLAYIALLITLAVVIAWVD